jgi:hypothetical protein
MHVERGRIYVEGRRMQREEEWKIKENLFVKIV